MKTWPQLCATYLINEIAPRCKKHHISLDDIRPAAIIIAQAEYLGKITRYEARQHLDWAINEFASPAGDRQA